MSDIEISIVDGNYQVHGPTHHEVFSSKMRALAAATALAAQAANASGAPARIVVPTGWGEAYLVSASGLVQLS